MENANNNCSGSGKMAVCVIAGLGTFLIIAFLVQQMIVVTRPAPVAAERATARAADNAAIRGEGADALKTWGIVKEPSTAKAQGIVRMPIDEAMKLTVQGYQQPATFRSNLLTRVEKANAIPKNEFE